MEDSKIYSKWNGMKTITISSVSDAMTTLYYAGCACALVPAGQIEKAKEVVTNLMAQVCV